MKLKAAIILGTVLCSMAGCAGDPAARSPKKNGVAGTDAAGGGAQAGDAGVLPDGALAVDGFHVTLSASERVVCPGKCTSLSAVAVQGIEPYSYRFDQGLPEGAGPHELCPKASTTYSVTVKDSSIDSFESAARTRTPRPA